MRGHLYLLAPNLVNRGILVIVVYIEQTFEIFGSISLFSRFDFIRDVLSGLSYIEIHLFNRFDFFWDYYFDFFLSTVSIVLFNCLLSF